MPKEAADCLPKMMRNREPLQRLNHSMYRDATKAVSDWAARFALGRLCPLSRASAASTSGALEPHRQGTQLNTCSKERPKCKLRIVCKTNSIRHATRPARL